jgi:predicted alpha/beta-hydrolase family hydrolase
VPTAEAKPVVVAVDDATRVSALLLVPARARACYVLAHGAGAGMNHPFMAAVAQELAERDVGTLRYQFPYMEKGGKRPDPPKLAHATVRAAVAETARRLPKLPLIAGGKSFGGPHDIASAGDHATSQRTRARVSRLSAAPGQAAVIGTRQASVRC